MSLLFLEEDPWLLEHESCEKLYRDIMEQLTFRQKHPRSSNKYSEISANIRLRLKQYNNEVSQLNQKLEITSKSGNITSAESERRTRQIELLHSKGVQMQKMFDEQVLIKSQEDRRELVGIGNENIFPSTSYSANNLKETQKRMLGEQEKGLENLSKIISRQKDIAHTISNEVDYHNALILSQYSKSSSLCSQTTNSIALKRIYSDFKNELSVPPKIKKKINILTPKLVAVLDRTQTSDMNSMYIIAAVVKSLGFDIDKYNLSYSFIRNAHISKREKIDETIKKEEIDESLVVHWDGILPTG